MSNLQRAKKRYSRTKRVRAEKLSFNLFNRLIGSTTISFEESKEGIVVATLKFDKQISSNAVRGKKASCILIDETHLFGKIDGLEKMLRDERGVISITTGIPCDNQTI